MEPGWSRTGMKLDPVLCKHHLRNKSVVLELDLPQVELKDSEQRNRAQSAPGTAQSARPSLEVRTKGSRREAAGYNEWAKNFGESLFFFKKAKIACVAGGLVRRRKFDIWRRRAGVEFDFWHHVEREFKRTYSTWRQKSNSPPTLLRQKSSFPPSHKTVSYAG